MPVTTVRTPDGKTVKVKHPEGATKEEIIAYAKRTHQEQPKDSPAAKPTEAGNGQFSFGEMVSNIPGSAYNFASGIYDAVTNPAETADSVRRLVSGGTQKLFDAIPALPGDTSRMPPGLIEAINADNRPMADAFGQAMYDRYGSVDNALNTLEQDPVGLLADVSSVAMPATKGLLNPVSMPRNAIRTVVGKVLPKSTPARIYERTAKFGTTLDDAERARLIDTALTNQILPSATGVRKLQGIIKALNSKVDDLISRSEASGKTVPRTELYKFIDDLKQKTGGWNVDAPKELQAIDDMIGSFEDYAKANLPDNLTARDLQTFKVNTYDKINWDAKHLAGTPVRESTLKTLARGAKDSIEQVVPETKSVNAELSRLYELQPNLQRVANRLDNRNLIQIQAPLQIGAGTVVADTLLGPGGSKVGAALSTIGSLLGHHKIAPRIALAMRRAQDESLMRLLGQQGPVSIGLLGAGQADRINDLQPIPPDNRPRNRQQPKKERP